MTPATDAGTEANCRHLYGYGDPNHKPSILQTITKCVLMLMDGRTTLARVVKIGNRSVI